LAPPPYGIAFADSGAPTVQRQPVAENRTGHLSHLVHTGEWILKENEYL
jgi:hypothetical protein